MSRVYTLSIEFLIHFRILKSPISLLLPLREAYILWRKGIKYRTYKRFYLTKLHLPSSKYQVCFQDKYFKTSDLLWLWIESPWVYSYSCGSQPWKWMKIEWSSDSFGSQPQKRKWDDHLNSTSSTVHILIGHRLNISSLGLMEQLHFKILEQE